MIYSDSDSYMSILHHIRYYSVPNPSLINNQTSTTLTSMLTRKSFYTLVKSHKTQLHSTTMLYQPLNAHIAAGKHIYIYISDTLVQGFQLLTRPN